MEHLKNKSALIVVDMQNFFYGKKPSIPLNKYKDILGNQIQLISLARSNNIPVIWTRAHHENMGDSIYQELNPYHFKNNEPIFTKDSLSFQIIDELKEFVQEDDILIDKEKYSAFYKTQLHVILKKRNIKTLIFCGVTTNICVESSIRDAFEYDYVPILISDCTSSLNEDLEQYSIDIIRAVFGFVISLQELEKNIK
ncbi:MAG: cysteine hydrolase [Prolixibacteraceae bacterium]|nr:cysteine hydrolase [Prolixibacteraceae bacterium]